MKQLFSFVFVEPTHYTLHNLTIRSFPSIIFIFRESFFWKFLNIPHLFSHIFRFFFEPPMKVLFVLKFVEAFQAFADDFTTNFIDVRKARLWNFLGDGVTCVMGSDRHSRFGFVKARIYFFENFGILIILFLEPPFGVDHTPLPFGIRFFQQAEIGTKNDCVKP
ncbi:MAG: hypothetical protein FWD31_04605 [Planctomycetaceae bacterium]|nr:hypothetical protein [Planctomycetaceae bacterium]